MKFPRLLPLIFSAGMVCTSCLNNTNEDPQNFDAYGNGEYTSDYSENNTQKTAKNDAMRYINVIDSRNGLVMSRVPFPNSWQRHEQGKYAYTGANGLKIHRDRGAHFVFSNDPQVNQMYRQNGVQVQLPKSIEQIVSDEFMPYAQRINRKLIRQYPIPQLAAWDKQFDGQLYKSMPAQKTFNVMGLEWRDPDGTSFLTVLHHIVSYDQFGGYWGITYTILETAEGDFEQAKKQYLNGLLNQQINPQWLRAVNQKDMQIAQQSNAQHQQRMASIQQWGQQNTARFNERMAAMDQNMQSWRANQAANDRSHSQFIDYINDNTNVTDPNTGQSYKVESGANQYWMNNDNEYIKSDNSLYDPNLDPNINNQTWTEYKEQQ